MSRNRYPEIAAAIKSARLRKGWSQEHAAKQLGCSRLQWIRWEQGLHRPADYVTRLAELLGIPKEQLLEDEDDEEAAPAMSLDALLDLRISAALRALGVRA